MNFLTQSSVMMMACIAILFLQSSQAAILFKAESTNEWVSAGHADPVEDTVEIMFAIRQNNLELVEKLFWEVSDPSSELYGQYLSFQELGGLVQNKPATAKVLQFVRDNQGTEVWSSKFGEFVRARFPVSAASEALKTSFHRFTRGDKQIVRALDYVLPDILSDAITHIENVIYFPDQFPALITSSSSTNVDVDPAFIRKVYSIDGSLSVSSNATQGVLGALGQSFSPQDLADFQNAYGMPLNPISTVIGSEDASACASNEDNCIEANLDVQYITSMAPKAATTFWGVSDQSHPFSTWLSQMADASEPPLVNSMSYGGYEQDTSNMQLFNTEAQKLGLRGITILVSSGDDGVANFGARGNIFRCGYNPSFPATSPYVTAVGATQGPENGQAEEACSSKTGGIVTSGGGFSKTFAAPAYQKKQVASYFAHFTKLFSKPFPGYNKNGRGYPDISFLGHNYAMYVNGQVVSVSGTSASAPSLAGLVTLINNERLLAGKPSLGFLNPALYSISADSFNDITKGSNNCAASGGIGGTCCLQGFKTAAGWDPVTGLGSPNFPVLLESLKAL